MRNARVNRHLTWVMVSVAAILSGALFASCSTTLSTGTVSSAVTPTSSALVIHANPTPTPLPTAQTIPTPTSTPIYATEVASPTAAPLTNNEVVWQASILSDSSRQYFSNGSPVNLCRTSWSMNLSFVVKPDGSVSGDGAASLSQPRTCSANNDLVPNVTDYTVNVSGSKKNSEFDLQLSVSSFKPDGTGEFGGFNEVFVNPQCNPIPTRRTLIIPLSSATSATGALDFADTMTGCAGSGDDVMKDKSTYDLHMSGTCATAGANTSDPEIVKLCR